MKNKIQLKKLQNEILHLLFPPRCCICRTYLGGREADGSFCPDCFADICYVTRPLCGICGKSFAVVRDDDHHCESCLRNRPYFRRARAVAYYDDPVRTLLHRLKYNFDTTVEKPLLEIALYFDFSAFWSCDIVVPVPLHKKRLKKRGLNHALTLAHLFFKGKENKIVADVLLRTRNTISQSSLDAKARKRNVASAFMVKDPDYMRKKTICLVDDIYTTGATVNECSRVLKDAGAKEVCVLTMTRVKKTDDTVSHDFKIKM